MQLPIQKCPYCGCTEFVVGYQNAEGMVMYKKIGMFGKLLRHLICRNCGIIVCSKVDSTDKFERAETAWK